MRIRKCFENANISYEFFFSKDVVFSSLQRCVQTNARYLVLFTQRCSYENTPFKKGTIHCLNYFSMILFVTLNKLTNNYYILYSSSRCIFRRADFYLLFQYPTECFFVDIDLSSKGNVGQQISEKLSNVYGLHTISLYFTTLVARPGGRITG